VVLAPAPHDLHPDHAAAGQAVQEAIHPAGMRNFDAAGQPFRPTLVLHYFLHDIGTATVVIDVTDVWKRRLQLAQCFTSQIRQALGDGFSTSLSRPDFLPSLEARARVWGRRVGFELGEPLHAMTGAIGVRDVYQLFGSVQCVSE
jgi:LmbE family N-acetylglucosaminyl deacetylase